jgi:site-specific DNA recombinase
MTVISGDAVIYLRVSTKDQAERGGEAEGFSIPAQREACYRKAEQLGATVAAEFVDAGESARSAARPDLQRMLGYLAKHPTNYVIVHKVDRLARNRADDVEINLAIQRAGCTLVSVTENIDETPSGMLLHGIMSSIAEFYSRNLASEVTKGMSQKAQSGGTVSIAPIGYRNVRTMDQFGREIRTVEVDPDRAPLIRWAFDTYSDGEWSTAMLLEELTVRGLTTRSTPKRPAKPLTISGMHKLLTNPYYMGEVVYRGVRYAGRHQALIDPVTWQRVQAIRAAHTSAGDRQQAHDHYLKGTVYCGSCDSRLVITHSTNRHGVTYPYFICSGRHRKRTTCTRQAVLIDWVERQIERDYAGIALPAQVAQAMVDMLSRDLADLHRSAERERQQLERERDRLHDEQASLLQAHYAGAVPLDLLKQEQTRISSRLIVLRQRLDGAETEHARVQANLQTCLAYLQDCHAAYLSAPPTVRRQLNQAFFHKVYVDEDGTVRFDIADPFALLLDPQVRSAALTTGTSADLATGTPELAETGDSGQTLAGHRFGRGLNKTTMVELRGFEPLAPSMRTRCATGLRHSPQPVRKITSREPAGSPPSS